MKRAMFASILIVVCWVQLGFSDSPEIILGSNQFTLCSWHVNSDGLLLIVRENSTNAVIRIAKKMDGTAFSEYVLASFFWWLDHKDTEELHFGYRGLDHGDNIGYVTQRIADCD